MPLVGKEIRIDIGETPIRIDVGTREQRLDERRADAGGMRPQLADVRVLRLTYEIAWRPMVEIVRIDLAGVRRVEHQRNRRDRGIVPPPYAVERVHRPAVFDTVFK